MHHALELLDHARRLLSPTGHTATQADLRRSVSACYYAVFHLLVWEAADRIGQAMNQALRFRMTRAFQPREMRRVCKQFGKITTSAVPKPLEGLVVAPLHPDLAFIAATFIELHDARHFADYDFELAVTYSYAAGVLRDTQSCLAAWASIQSLPETTTFLTPLLLADRWIRRG